MIENELSRYGGLEDRPRLVALNKIDVPDGRDIAGFVVDELRERGLRVFEVSAASGEGTARADLRDGRDRARPPGPRSRSEATRIVLRPPSADGKDEFTITADRGRLAGARREARALGPPDRLQQRRGRRLPRRPAQPARRRDPAGQARAPRRATPCSSATPTTRSSSTSSPASTPAPRSSAVVARTSASTRRARRPTAAAAIQEAHARPRRGRDPCRRGPPPRQAPGRTVGPSSYEIGTPDDPDWAENDPEA